IEQPIEIFHWLRHDNMSIFPHLLLVTDELAKVTVIEHFRSCDRSAPGFACGVNDLIAGPGAKISYVCAQEWSSNTIALQMNSTSVDHDASTMSLNLNLGSRYSRFEVLTGFFAKAARRDFLAVAVEPTEQNLIPGRLKITFWPNT